MVDWAKLKMWDYTLSLKLARLLHYDGNGRKLVQIFTFTGTSFAWFFGLIFVYFLIPELRVQSYTILFVTLLMLIPVFIIKHTIKRPRPEFKDTRYGAVAFDEWSFPSGHSTRATYITIIMITFFPNWTFFWVLWGICVMLSRLLLGVHYITDIIAGFILSSFSMFILFLVKWLPVAPLSHIFT